jgi:hypothetical protein
MLVFPFGAALIISFFFYIIDTKQIMEIDGNVQIQILLNSCFDLHDSAYIALTNVSTGRSNE